MKIESAKDLRVMKISRKAAEIAKKTHEKD